jgi:hypothetical protein
MQGANHEVKIAVPHFIGSDDPRLHHVRSQLDRRHPPVLRQLVWRSKPAELLNRSKNGSKPYPGSVPVRDHASVHPRIYREPSTRRPKPPSRLSLYSRFRLFWSPHLDLFADRTGAALAKANPCTSKSMQWGVCNRPLPFYQGSVAMRFCNTR